MINCIRRKLAKRRIKRTFSEYGSQVTEFELPEFGKVRFSRWLNPLEGEKVITQGQVDFYQKFLRKGDFIIDIGAHIGDSTMPMALAVGKEGLSLAFDPNPYVYSILVENAALNPSLTHIVPLNMAITSHDGDFYYNSSEATFNNGGIAETKENYHGKYGLSHKVRGVNLFTFLTTTYPEELQRLKLIKVDAEGYDIEILKSILPVIQKYKPHLIFECFKQLKKQGRYDLFDLIAAQGYNLHYVEDFDVSAKMELLHREGMTHRKHFDIIAIPNNPEPK